MIYHSFPLGQTIHTPPHVARVDTVVLERSLTEYRHTLRLLAFCDSEQAADMRAWMRDAVAFLEREVDVRRRNKEALSVL